MHKGKGGAFSKRALSQICFTKVNQISHKNNIFSGKLFFNFWHKPLNLNQKTSGKLDKLGCKTSGKPDKMVCKTSGKSDKSGCETLGKPKTSGYNYFSPLKL